MQASPRSKYGWILRIFLFGEEPRSGAPPALANSDSMFGFERPDFPGKYCIGSFFLRCCACPALVDTRTGRSSASSVSACLPIYLLVRCNRRSELTQVCYRGVGITFGGFQEK